MARWRFLFRAFIYVCIKSVITKNASLFREWNHWRFSSVPLIILSGRPLTKESQVQSSQLTNLYLIYYRLEVYLWRATVHVRLKNVLSCRELDVEIDTTLMSGHQIWSWGQQLVNSAWRKDRKRLALLRPKGANWIDRKIASARESHNLVHDNVVKWGQSHIPFFIQI